MDCIRAACGRFGRAVFCDKPAGSFKRFDILASVSVAYAGSRFVYSRSKYASFLFKPFDSKDERRQRLYNFVCLWAAESFVTDLCLVYYDCFRISKLWTGNPKWQENLDRCGADRTADKS